MKKMPIDSNLTAYYFDCESKSSRENSARAKQLNHFQILQNRLLLLPLNSTQKILDQVEALIEHEAEKDANMKAETKRQEQRQKEAKQNLRLF